MPEIMLTSMGSALLTKSQAVHFHGVRRVPAGGVPCVEVAPTGVLVRDSKDADGPVLAVTTTAWRAFLATVTD